MAPQASSNLAGVSSAQSDRRSSVGDQRDETLSVRHRKDEAASQRGQR